MLKETEICTFNTETNESLLHLFWECTDSKKNWCVLVNVLKNYSLNMQYKSAPNIILDLTNPLNPDNIINQVILILKFYLYKCICLGENLSINGGMKYMQYRILK